MKITKKQLRRIIKEERARLEKQRATVRPLKESVTDMRHYEEMIEVFAFDVSERFMLDMGDMYEEDPEMFNQSPQEWNKETMAASSELDRKVSLMVANAVKEMEAKLHNGDYAGK